MAPPLLVPKRKTAPEEAPEDDDDTDASEATPVGKKALVVPKSSAPPKMPLMVYTDPADLTEEQVAEAVEKAVKRTSSFGIKVGAIQEYLRLKDYHRASLTAKEQLLSTLVDLLPVAEKSFRKSGASKGTYQFMALIGQMRELLVDLDGERDMNSTIQNILDSAVHPVFMTLAQQIIQFNASVKRRMRTEFSEQECKEKLYPIMDEHIKDLATYVQSMFSEVSRRVEKSVE